MKKILINMIPIGKLKHKLLEKYFPNEYKVIINKNTKCLVVGPHPDDETIGCGGMMLKYTNNFDCVCMASSGIGKGVKEAEKNSDVRIDEFKKVMSSLHIKNFWIFKTFGVPPMYSSIRKNMWLYKKLIKTNIYDYIFLPHPLDNHREHRYITNKIFKKVLRRNGYKRNLKICYYGVWTPVPKANCFLDITSVMSKKYNLLKLYKSQNKQVSYPDMADGLNKYYGALSHANMCYAEALKIVSVRQYLFGKR